MFIYKGKKNRSERRDALLRLSQRKATPRIKRCGRGNFNGEGRGSSDSEEGQSVS